MKKILSTGAFLIALLIIAFVVIATKDKEVLIEREKDQETVETKIIYETGFFKEETDKHLFSINYPISNFSNVNDDINSYIEGLKVLIKETENNNFNQIRPHVLDLSFDVKDGDNYITFILQASIDTGGAHPNTSIKTFTYTKDGERLNIFEYLKKEFNDIFLIDSIALEVQRILKNEVGNNDWDIQIETGASASYENFELFYEENENVYFIFPPYTVGPYVWGIHNIPVSKEYLNSKVKK